jgi:curved DNA-binding protein CbpA
MADDVLKKIPDDIVNRIEEYDRNLQKWSYYDLLYIPRNSDKAMIKKGYYRIVQLMHPDRYWLDLEGEYKQKLERIFNEINIAYNALINESERAKYDQSLYYAEDHDQPLKVSNDVVVAKAQYTRGINALKQDEIVAAIEFFRSAIDLDSDKADYYAKLAFAIAKHKNPRYRREAIEHCRQAISMQHENPNYHALMGYIYQQLGQPQEAKTHYKRALSWDPQHQRSKKELQKITQHEIEENKQKSLKHKLFSFLKPPAKSKSSADHSKRRSIKR